MSELQKAIEKLDGIFSIYIRRRDANLHGFITCISCKKQITWKESSCCHYANRQHMATRFDEINNHAGCTECNCLNKGFHIHEYEKFLDLNYGIDTAQMIIDKSRIITKFTLKEIQEKIIYYKLRNKEYEKN